MRKVPVLKTCENWNDVQEVGLVDHKTKYAYYNGILVKYGDRLFYVSEERMQALAPFRKWTSTDKIRVIDLEKQ